MNINMNVNWLHQLFIENKLLFIDNLILLSSEQL